ncbi:hypothetical protein CaCOL14_008037 [Colletotrichum acutatum]
MGRASSVTTAATTSSPPPLAAALASSALRLTLLAGSSSSSATAKLNMPSYTTGGAWLCLGDLTDMAQLRWPGNRTTMGEKIGGFYTEWQYDGEIVLTWVN